MSSSRSSRRSRDRKHGSASTPKTKATTNTTITEKTKRCTPKDANYQQRLIDGGVYPYGYEYPSGGTIPEPSGWEDLHQKLAKSRASLSPSKFPEDEYQAFVRADARASGEDAVKDSVLSTMLRAINASDGAHKNKLFTKMEPIVDGIARAKPDYYYGAQQEQIEKNIREELYRYIVPSEDGLAVPNFSLEAKGPTGSGAEALRQACHNGAIGARAMHSLQTYGEDDPVYDHIRSISSTYHLGTLKMYGHSVAQPNGPGTQPEYYMHQIKGWSMTGDKETFLKGATAYKNALDLTAEHRNAAIERANAIAHRSSTAAEEVVQEDEDSFDDEDKVEEEDEAAPVIYPSFVADSANSSARTEAEEDEDEDDSETFVDTDYRRPPAKRPSAKSQSSSRRCSHKSHKSSSPSVSKGKQRKSWFAW